MKKKIIIVSTSLIILSILLVGCSFNRIKHEEAVETQLESILVEEAKSTDYKLEKKIYINKDVKIKYPQINGLQDTKKEEIINNIIKTKAISIYDNTIKELEKGQTYEVDGSYEIKLKNDEILSIAYNSYNNITPSAHPYNLFYTTNIDIKKGKELKTKDIIPNVNDEFIKLLKKGKYVGTVEKDYQDQLMKFVCGNYPNPDDLIDVVENAYVYITEKNIGVSIPIPHVAGDYVPIEINKKDLEKLK